MWHSDKTPVMTFVLEECLPVRLSGPSLNARTGEIAIEEIQLVYTYLSVKAEKQGAPGTSASPGQSVGGTAPRGSDLLE